MIKRIPYILVLLVGVFWVSSTFALSYSAKTDNVDELTNSFRPVFSDAGEAQTRKDMATVNAFAADFQGKALPALAQQLGTDPGTLATQLGTAYPAVGSGISQLPTILPYFNTVTTGLQQQQSSFQKADDIPTSYLPASTVHWLFVVLGLLAIGLGGFGLVRPKRVGLVLGLAGTLGVAVIAVTFALGVPAKAQGVDQMTAAFRPVFTQQGAAQTAAYLDTLKAMDTQLNDEALPGLAGMLKVTPAQLGSSLGSDFPRVATGLQQMPAILARFEVLVTKIQQNVGTFQSADSIPTATAPTTDLVGQLVGPAGLLVVVAALGAATGLTRRRRETTKVLQAHRREPELEPAR